MAKDDGRTKDEEAFEREALGFALGFLRGTRSIIVSGSLGQMGQMGTSFYLAISLTPSGPNAPPSQS